MQKNEDLRIIKKVSGGERKWRFARENAFTEKAGLEDEWTE